MKKEGGVTYLHPLRHFRACFCLNVGNYIDDQAVRGACFLFVHVFGLLFCTQFLQFLSSPFVHSFSHLGKERTDMGETGTNGGAGGISVSSRPSGDVEMQKGQDNETAAGSGTHLVGVVGKLRSQ